MIAAPPEWTSAAGQRAGATVVDLLEADLLNGSGSPAPLRLWTGHGEIVWSGVTWYGAGQLLEVEPVPSAGDGEPASVRIALVATDALIGTIASHRTHGRRLRLWRGWLASDGSLITPVLTATLVIDEIWIEDDQRAPVVRVTAVDVLADLDRPRLRRLSPETQALRDPTDRGLDYVPSMDRAELDIGRGYWRREARRAG